MQYLMVRKLAHSKRWLKRPSVLILCHPSGMTRLRDVVEGRREQWLQRAEWVCCAAFQDCLGAQFFKLLDRVMPDWEKRKINLERVLA